MTYRPRLYFSSEQKSEFRALTPSQVRFANLIAQELGIELDESIIHSKLATEEYIQNYHLSLEKLREVELDDDI